MRRRMQNGSAWVVGMCIAALPLIASAADTSLSDAWDAEGFDCRVLDGQSSPETAAQWFERSLWAKHCYTLQASAVRISSDGVRTLALSHDIQDGIEREVARFLDGPQMVYERRGRIGRAGWTEPDKDVPASPSVTMDHVREHYRLTLGEEERIAGRKSVRLDIEPLDSMRYGHRLWLDYATALPLKQMLVRHDGRVLETFQLTGLERPTLYDGRIQLDELRTSPETDWEPGWLPNGYAPQPIAMTRDHDDDGIRHRLFSDGLSTLSVFVEPLEAGTPSLSPGMHRLGISYAAVRHIDVDDQPRQVMAMGELPPRVLLQVVEQIEWRSDDDSNDTVD
ncbi:MucB/RseB C-terminal domain-containing protein [Aidingimonas lacisalsi]|uniref:MucB/RseB C-terminal domain-containing protein n=1 Tax=Aidingimonas lacisalsi TaxID=2604086 RepID=UPI001F2E0E2E|nr:MucB/RseB C-terminal domain-containing protein [Aidingimonas lacisalsi]